MRSFAFRSSIYKQPILDLPLVLPTSKSWGPLEAVLVGVVLVEAVLIKAILPTSKS